MAIWGEIRKLEGQTLRTLDRGKRFDVVSVTENTVTVMPHETHEQRPIDREMLEDAYRFLEVTGQITRTDIRAEYSEFNSAYVAAILAEMPGVKYSVAPIRLRFHREGTTS